MREGRRTGQLQVRLVTSRRGKLDVDGFADAVDADGLLVDAGRRPRREHRRRRDRAARRQRRSSTSSSAACDFLISPEAFFQTNTEMAEKLYGVAIEYAGAAAAASASSTSTAGSARSACRSPPRAGEVIGPGDRRGRPSPTRSRTRASTRSPTRSFFAGDVRLALRELVERAGQARRRRRRSAARRPLAEDRAPDRRRRPAPDRLRLLQPDDARAQRGAARRGRLRACARCARSTCSRRRRTSSAWRCWSASDAGAAGLWWRSVRALVRVPALAGSPRRAVSAGWLRAHCLANLT